MFIHSVRKIVEYKFQNLDVVIEVLKKNPLTFELVKNYRLGGINDYKYLDLDYYQIAIQVIPDGTLNVFHLENDSKYACKDTDKLFSQLMGEKFLETLLLNSEHTVKMS